MRSKTSNIILLKWVHSIILVLNIFPNSHLIQKCKHNQQLHFWVKWRLGKIFNTKMIGWPPFSEALLYSFEINPNHNQIIYLYCQIDLFEDKRSFINKLISIHMNSYCYYKIVIAHLTFHDIWSPANGNNGLLCRELRRIWLTKLSAKLSWAEACELKVSKFQKQIFLFSFEPKTEQNYFLISDLHI